MSYRTKLRGAVVGSCTITLLAGAGLFTLPAQAAPATPAVRAVQAVSVAHATRARRDERPAAEVASFFQAYQDAVNGTSSKTPQQVREEYMSAVLNTELDLWASTHQADPIYRKNEPIASFSTTGQAPGELGHTDVYLTMNYTDGTSLNVAYTVRDSDLAITGLKNTPS
ncbi:hypothetical protein [Streptacidiphilus albus]|uniref:hypothetical protein n=1 Tax=Streptacidiphilus albus TaxID=105425 RepID=UPI00054C43CF|nr:hypothetical protein [Streptacidiphilus albus]